MQQNFYFVAFAIENKKEARQYGLAAGLPYFVLCNVLSLYAVFGSAVYVCSIERQGQKKNRCPICRTAIAFCRRLEIRSTVSGLPWLL